jgi:hypothetical protein
MVEIMMAAFPACRGGTRLGRLVAAALTGAWRQAPPPPSLSPGALAVATPRLLETGAGGLGWWGVRRSSLRDSQAACRLQQAYRLQVLQAARHGQQIERAVRFLHSAGIEPLLAKGWTVARLYPEPALRPFGDIDLFVRPEQHATAAAALSHPHASQCPVDLHRGFPDLKDRTLTQLFKHSRASRVGEVKVRILGPEDQLRHLCLHLVRHGAWRPLWLCDIGAAVENRPADFDWNYFLSGDRRRSDWASCAIGLAHELLGARVEDTPVARRAKNLPPWLVPAVLRQWGLRYVRNTDARRILDHLGHPARFLRALRHRWPNPIEATVSLRGPFNVLPRLPFQLGDCFARAVQVLKSLGAGETRSKRLSADKD